jgi:chlorobactene glucosyltransferase
VKHPKSDIPNRKSLWTLAFSLSVLPLLARSERVYGSLPRLPRQAQPPPRTSADELPPLSVIVPARNEEHNLQRLLPSLMCQQYPGEMEIIVVDDHSTDTTAEIVRCSMRDTGCGMRLIPAADLPDGWLGKQNASHAGASAARGQWLLFTDADTEHDPHSAASAVAYAEKHGLDGLSLFPQQRTRGLLDSSVLMVAFAGLFAAMRRSTTMLNGQYILVRRDVYERSGGFAAVRAEMLDDLAYGELLAKEGYRAPMMRGDGLVGVHMYEDTRQMWHGVSRLGSGSLRFQGPLSLISAIFVTGVMMPIWTLLFNRHYIRDIRGLWLVWLAGMAGFLPWAKRFNYQQSTTNNQRQTTLRALAAPAAAVFVQLSALWGIASRLLGRGLSWKDRKV